MDLEKKTQTNNVMVISVLSCDDLTDSRFSTSGWLGGRGQMLNGLSLHPSDFGQSRGCGNHIRDRNLDLNDLRFFQGPLRDETEPSFADVLSIPLCFLLTGFLQG